MNWLTVLIANAILTFVVTVAYMRDPTPALYGTPSIFLSTFSNSISKSFNNFKFVSNGVPSGLHSFHVETLENILDVAHLVHSDDTCFSIPLLGNNATL
jgi:hypothetical protein